MRKIFTLLLLVAGFAATAQKYNHEWIKFSQTYFKIKIARDGVYRIPRSLLDAMGIGGSPVQNFEIWRNGEKVPFYPSVSSGTLPGNGYLEFWGEQNDGKPDKPLYRAPEYQHSTKYSLQTDTAVYFLSVSPSTAAGFRYTDVSNNAGSSPLPVEPYFMYTAGFYPQNGTKTPNFGLASIVGVPVYSSSYDQGEVFASPEIAGGGVYPAQLSGLNVYSAGPQSSLKFGAVGVALNTRNIKVRMNGVEVKDTVMNYYNDLVSNAPVDNSTISSGTVNFEFQNTSATSLDRMVVSFLELTYPRNWNFNGQSNFKFTLPANSSGYLLHITNFNYGSNNIAPVLYDTKSGERFSGDISTPGTVKFALPGKAVSRDLVLVSEDPANINTVTAFAVRNFINYKLTATQGNYLIITNPILYTGTSGNNPVDEYRMYRASAAGGGYTPIVVDIDLLVDQFAFGIKKHPLSIHNFLRFARDSFSVSVKSAFLIGRGMNYSDYQRYDRGQNNLADRLNLVPTWGWPGSDNLLSAQDITFPVATTPIGRLSAVSGKELEDYLEKVKEYELVQKTAPNTIAARAWMKQGIHVTGSSDVYLGTVLCNYMDVYQRLIEDTLIGAKVNTFCKTSTNPVEQVAPDKIARLFNEGISFLNYFGHSSATTLEFNIDEPQNYNNQGKYPVFFVNGCKAGDFFTYYSLRLSSIETLSEKYTLAKQRGSIAFVASTHYGVVNYLNLYLTELYGVMNNQDYNKPLGEVMRDALGNMLRSTGSYDFYSRMHAEEIELHGDPAVKMNTQAQADYVIEEPLIKISPLFISLAEKSFKLKIKTMNLGKAVGDSVTLEIKQQYPNGSTGVVYRQKIPKLRYADSIELEVPIIATRDKGQNKIIATIDADNVVSEITESNNTATKDFFIFEEEARPAFPYNYAIINKQPQTLYASTANPLSTLRNYVMEIDTSGKFDSPLKVTKSASSTGGIIEFNSNLTYIDSTVYYWRVAPVQQNGAQLQWSTSSFMYKPNTDGYNQSQYWQHIGSTNDRLILDSASQTWMYGTNSSVIQVRNCIFGSGQQCNQENHLQVEVNSYDRIQSACLGRSLVFNVFDSVSLQPWKNVDANNNALFLYGSANSVCASSVGGDNTLRRHNFEYSYMTAADRKKAMDFMDLIPDGNYVVVRSFDRHDPNSYSATWAADTSLYLANGPNISLYHKLLGAGFVGIDSIYKPRAWFLIYQKGSGSTFAPVWGYGDSVNSVTRGIAYITSQDTLGYMRSPNFGPAKKWRTLEWKGTSTENPSYDKVTLDVIGINKNGVETVLNTIDKSVTSFDLSGVDEKLYPFIALKMRNEDRVGLTPYQLKYWRIYYDPIPEGSMAANMYVVSKDTMQLGETMKFGIAFKNISYNDFPDSVLVKAYIIDRNNVTHDVFTKNYKPIIVGDTIKIDMELSTASYPGNNTLYLTVNPDYEQPEHYLSNNFVYKDFYVRPDNERPLLDVTFDGVHILNNDIVSAKPHIQIKIKDESKYALLSDTTISTVQVRYPDGTLRTYHFDGDTLRFIPATSTSDNTATIEFTPQFTNQIDPNGDDYELIVVGKDASGNKASDIAYRIGFKVISKPMISNLLNYPNPFSTSTAFVFTVTGSDLPQNIRIQILTVTGKIVREITMNELGPLHIGRNITEFKWDGTDQYGQKLGNGVYLYRVVTSLNGKPMDKYKATNDDTDKYFNNGYGKMYLMR